MKKNGSMPYKSLAYAVIFLVIVGFGYWFFVFRSPVQGLQTDVALLADKDHIVPLAIIGSGPAGLAAGLYGARGGVHTVVFEGSMPGGQLMETSWVENWPGMPKKMGPDLIRSLREQALEFGVSIASKTVNHVDLSRWPFVLTTDDGEQITALSVVIATGATPRKLGVPGETAYWGKGVTTCAVCDAPFYKDRDVFVVGGGDSAVEEAMQLSSYAKNITMLVRGSALRASTQMQERLKAYDNVSVSYKTKIKEIKGDGAHVTNVDLLIDGVQENRKVNGVFLAIGHKPNSATFFDPYTDNNFIARDKQGYIVLGGRRQETSVRGVFAAGDVADHRYRQAGVAAGDGIKAALDALDFLRDIGYTEELEEQLLGKLFSAEGGVGRMPLSSIDSLAMFEKISQDSAVPLILDFYTQYCPSCMGMLPMVESVAAAMADQVKIYKVDAMKAADLAEKFSVSKVPTFILVHEGQLLARAQSAMKRDEFESFVKAAIER